MSIHNIHLFNGCVCEHTQYTLMYGLCLRAYTIIYTYVRAVFASIHNIHLFKGFICEHTQ